jgi:hypothetical protein
MHECKEPQAMRSSHKTSIPRLLLALTLTGLALPWAGPAAGATETAAGVMQDFQTADKDHDGYLSGEEGRDYVGTSLHLDDLAFRAADVDGDGRLSPEEFANHVKASQPRPETPRYRPMYRPMPYSY